MRVVPEDGFATLTTGTGPKPDRLGVVALKHRNAALPAPLVDALAQTAGAAAF